MKLLIVQPSHYRSGSDRTPHKAKKRSVVGLTLPYLAALTPKGWQVELIDEQLRDIDFNAPVDLVAITCWTINSFRAYDIADRFRERKVPVIIGGPHAYFYWEEALQHCDAVGIGEAEGIWEEMLEDAANGCLKPIYRARRVEELSGLPFPRYDLLDLKRYGLFKTFSVQSSRGCPFKCDFCSERFYLGQAYRYRPVEDVVEEIRRTGGKIILFADSNFAGKRAHAVELMEALVPLRLRWSALWSVDLCRNKEFMDVAQRSGLLHVNIGIESIDQDTLSGMNKRTNKVDQYRDILADLRRRGVSYSLNFIFGSDTEKEDVFPATMAFLQANKVPVAYFNILTPHRGTPLYDRMKQDDRLLDDHNMGRWPGMNCCIKPRNSSPEELERRVKGLYKDFYTFPSMVARLPPPVTQASIASWVVNWSQRRMAHSHTPMENFDDY
jgi:radical SAM superfamily enzyme YgiQ (UPF0313 family)